jgi:hypothetical protein
LFYIQKRKEIENIIKDVIEIKIKLFNDKLKQELFYKINLLSYNDNKLIQDT